MKFIKEITPKGLLLPVTATRLAGFSAGDQVEYHTLNGAMLVLKGRMTAPELLTVVHQLTSASAQLLHHLSQVCGYCEDCDKDSCPFVVTSSISFASGQSPEAHSFRCSSSSRQTRCAGLCRDIQEVVQVNEHLREAAGIPDGAKLCAEVDEEAHTITVLAAEHRYDLRDLPADLLETFMAAGTCLGKLEEHLIAEDTVYGG